MSPPDFVGKNRLRGKAAEGVRYEKRVQEYLQDLYGDYYVNGFWLKYSNQNGANKWAQPDGILFLPESWKIVVIEIKLQHTDDAWYQIEWLYKPLLRFLWPSWEFVSCEVTKWFDPALQFPADIMLCSTPDKARKERFGVHIWKP